MRKLASVVTVRDVIPMEGNDKVVCCNFNELGFECVVPKDDAIPGNKLIFIQEGSILPEANAWEFLREKYWREDLCGYLIRPMIMGKKIDGTEVKSWGLGVSLRATTLTEGEIRRLKIGDDVTEALGIRKYEPEDAPPSKSSLPKLVEFCLSHAITRWIGNIYKKNSTNEIGPFPSGFINKPNETSIQNMISCITDFSEDSVYATVQMEGQSFTALLDPKDRRHKFYICSENEAYHKRVDNNFWKAAEKYNLEYSLKNLYKKTGLIYIVQGEQCGPEIKNNIYKFDDITWFVHTIETYNPKTGECKLLNWDEMERVCIESLQLKTVPLIGKWPHFRDIAPNMNALIEFAEKSYWKRDHKGNINFVYSPLKGEKLWRDYAQNKGIVIRTYDKSMSVKVKNLQYNEYQFSGGKI